MAGPQSPHPLVTSKFELSDGSSSSSNIFHSLVLENDVWTERLLRFRSANEITRKLAEQIVQKKKSLNVCLYVCPSVRLASISFLRAKCFSSSFVSGISISANTRLKSNRQRTLGILHFHPSSKSDFISSVFYKPHSTFGM